MSKGFTEKFVVLWFPSHLPREPIQKELSDKGLNCLVIEDVDLLNPGPSLCGLDRTLRDLRSSGKSVFCLFEMPRIDTSGRSVYDFAHDLRERGVPCARYRPWHLNGHDPDHNSNGRGKNGSANGAWLFDFDAHECIPREVAAALAAWFEQHAA